MAANSQFSMAVHIMTMLAEADHENVKSECLAGSVNTNAVVVRRILGQLGQANLVISQTGAAGGTRLSRDAKDIKLSEIYKAVCCGEVFALHPKGANQDCPIGRGVETVLCNLQKEIYETVGDKLSQYTLQDVMSMIEQGQVA
jgi:Rrf2 family protein